MINREVQGACNNVGRIINDLIKGDTNPADSTTACMAVTMSGLATVACCVMEGFNPHKDQLPREDHMLLAAFLVWGSCNLNHDGHLSVGFSPALVLDAMNHFEKFTGQSARPLVNKSLLMAVDHETLVKASDFGQNAKFLPH